MAGTTTFAYMTTITPPGGSGLYKTSAASTAGSYTVTEADATIDGNVAAGEAVDVGGTIYTYTGHTYDDGAGNTGIIVVDGGGNYFMFSTGSVASKLLLGRSTDPTASYSYAICFLPGTLIATPEGERAIETLAIGDMVTLANGASRPLKWLGVMTVNLNLFNRLTAAPILIRAGALGGGLPKRDLYTSYGHGFEIEGVLVLAGLLVNGTSIVQCSDWPESTIKYYQVEVEGHELMVVEGAAAETFGGAGDNRAKFDNAAEFDALYPDAVPHEPMALGHVTVARQLPRAVKARIEAAAVEMGYVKAA